MKESAEFSNPIPKYSPKEFGHKRVTGGDNLARFWRSFALFCCRAVLCVLLPAQFAVGTAFALQDTAGQTSPVLADPPSAQRSLAADLPEPLPEFDPDNPQAIGIILGFHRWPEDDEQTIILEKTREAGLTKTEEISRFKIWLFQWGEWKQAATAEKVCRSLQALSSLEYCEPDSLLGPAESALESRVGLRGFQIFQGQ